VCNVYFRFNVTRYSVLYTVNTTGRSARRYVCTRLSSWTFRPTLSFPKIGRIRLRKRNRDEFGRWPCAFRDFRVRRSWYSPNMSVRSNGGTTVCRVAVVKPRGNPHGRCPVFYDRFLTFSIRSDVGRRRSPSRAVWRNSTSTRDPDRNAWRSAVTLCCGPCGNIRSRVAVRQELPPSSGRAVVPTVFLLGELSMTNVCRKDGTVDRRPKSVCEKTRRGTVSARHSSTAVFRLGRGGHF